MDFLAVSICMYGKNGQIQGADIILLLQELQVRNPRDGTAAHMYSAACRQEECRVGMVIIFQTLIKCASAVEDSTGPDLMNPSKKWWS
jgi:hypothetical protein